MMSPRAARLKTAIYGAIALASLGAFLAAFYCLAYAPDALPAGTMIESRILLDLGSPDFVTAYLIR